MSTVRIRLIGSEINTNTLITVLHGVGGVGHIEDIAGLMPPINDNSAFNCAPGEDLAPGLHAIAKSRLPDPRIAERVREIASIAADLLEADVEFPDEF